MNKDVSIWDALPHWSAYMRENGITEDAGDAREALRMMCDCMKQRGVRTYSDGLHKLLVSWYMPRNERDVQYYTTRYAVLNRLPRYFETTLNHKSD